MTINDIAGLRLINQQIASSKFKTVKELVSYLGAVQAQDYPMAKWALGIRLPGSTEESIEKAINAGEIFRTHALRPTWHFVPADDISWMIELTGKNMFSVTSAMNKMLGLDDKILQKSRKIIEKSLEGGNHLSRNELMIELNKAKIDTSEQRASHIMLYVESIGSVCNGTRKGKDHTYSLISESAPNAKSRPKEEALGLLARRYFTSHGPATLKDFVWWSGLPVADARNGFELVKPKFVCESIGPDVYLFDGNNPNIQNNGKTIHYLPAYDEYLISYRDRSASIAPDAAKTAISSNGIFRPVIVINGKVAGTWKRTYKNNEVIIENNFFNNNIKFNKKHLQEAAAKYANFMGMKLKSI